MLASLLQAISKVCLIAAGKNTVLQVVITDRAAVNRANYYPRLIIGFLGSEQEHP